MIEARRVRCGNCGDLWPEDDTVLQTSPAGDIRPVCSHCYQKARDVEDATYQDWLDMLGDEE